MILEPTYLVLYSFVCNTRLGWKWGTAVCYSLLLKEDTQAWTEPTPVTQIYKMWSACMRSHSSRVLLVTTPWTVALQAPLSMGVFWQEYWSGLPCPPPGDLPNPGIEPESLMSPVLHVGSLPLAPPRKSYKKEKVNYQKFSVFGP